MQAIGYIRVSTEEQAREGVSLDAQEASLRAYCALKGVNLVEVIIDAGVTASKPLATREGGSRLLGMVKRGEVQAVVTYKLDRLFRNAGDCLQVTAAWDKAGVSLHLVDMGGQSIDTSSAMGRFLLTMLAGIAEMERNLISERTRFAMHHKTENREYTGGNVPYGWTLDKDGIHIVINPAEQNIIQAARVLRANGLSLDKVGRQLAAEGMLPRSGGRWHAKTVRDLINAEVA